MPHLPERTPGTITASIGGSTIHNPDGIDTGFVRELSCFLAEQIHKGHTVIAAVGGGEVARHYKNALVELGTFDPREQDRLGIKLTDVNAEFLKIAFANYDMPVSRRSPGEHIRPGVIYLMSGTVYGQTTDKIAVEAAIEAGVDMVFNISTSPLHPVRDGQIDTSEVIDELTWDEFLAMAPSDHVPGMHFPFDPNAARFARDHGITVILLGPDLYNVRRCLNGEEFIGTVVHPDLPLYDRSWEEAGSAVQF